MASRNNKRSIEYTYPNKKAREIADELVDGMSNDSTMQEYIVAWEEAYFAAGGTIQL